MDQQHECYSQIGWFAIHPITLCLGITASHAVFPIAYFMYALQNMILSDVPQKKLQIGESANTKQQIRSSIVHGWYNLPTIK